MGLVCEGLTVSGSLLTCTPQCRAISTRSRVRSVVAICIAILLTTHEPNLQVGFAGHSAVPVYQNGAGGSTWGSAGQILIYHEKAIPAGICIVWALLVPSCIMVQQVDLLGNFTPKP